MTQHLFDQLLRDEPPMRLTVEPIVAAAGRRQQRRRLLTTAGVLSGTALAATAVAVPLAGGSAPSRPTATVTVPAAALASDIGTVSLPDTLTADEQHLADLVEQASPAGLTFHFKGDHGSLEGTADDGTGPGRLMVSWTPQPGYQQVHPCLDPEFKAGVTCTEKVLPSGAVMSLRALTTWQNEEWYEAVVTRPDGSGYNLEAGNYTIPTSFPKVITSAEEKKRVTALTVTRPHPVYTLDQLATVLTALDAARP